MESQNSGREADTRWFYRDLPVLSSFEEAANGQNHTNIPDDWFVVICDVVGSTKAIDEGKYKNVNTVGAATIVSVLNVDRSVAVPYVFGGDGASLAIPPCMEHGVRQALLGSQALARTAFDLDLRIGLIPASHARRLGDRVAIGQYVLGDRVNQASFSGFGWEYAEKLLKEPSTRALYEVVETPDCKAEADFSGFECRWKPVPAIHEHKLAILVQSLSKSSLEHFSIYSKVLTAIQTIYGDVRDCHPLDLNRLVITLSPREAIQEIQVQTAGLPFLKKFAYILYLTVCLFVGRIVIGFGLSMFGIDWGAYKNDVVQNSDFRKFDGILKMVVDGTEKQKQQLEDFLKKENAAGHLAYGLHASPSAIVTCLVFSHNDTHSHFIDGSDGGYTMAAKMLKSQLAAYQGARDLHQVPA